MRIKRIMQDGDVYEVTKEPNFIEKFLGLGEIVERYKDIGEHYKLFSGTRVYVNQLGKKLGPTHKMTETLECWRRRF